MGESLALAGKENRRPMNRWGMGARKGGWKAQALQLPWRIERPSHNEMVLKSWPQLLLPLNSHTYTACKKPSGWDRGKGKQRHKSQSYFMGVLPFLSCIQLIPIYNTWFRLTFKVDKMPHACVLNWKGGEISKHEYRCHTTHLGTTVNQPVNKTAASSPVLFWLLWLGDLVVLEGRWGRAVTTGDAASPLRYKKKRHTHYVKINVLLHKYCTDIFLKT